MGLSEVKLSKLMKEMEDSVVMNGGDGPNSYTHNSKVQGEAIEREKFLLSSSIQQYLIVEDKSKATQIFTIADLGCSVGPNTFSCVNTMIKAVQSTFKNSEMPDFLVFFNDHVTNDFNTLFKALPLDRQYMATGVPGSFHGRLFPKASINLMHSSSSLHWLSKVPEEVTKMESPVWNKGKITYVESSSRVVEAYTAQFMKDLKSFLCARSAELAKDGLLVIYLLSRPDGSSPSESKFMQRMRFCLGHALADMAKEGIISEALVDSFNLPLYMPSASEFKEVVSSIKNLSIEKVGEICVSENLKTPDDCRTSTRGFRAIFEGMLCKHFGTEPMEELYERYAQKLHEYSKMPRFATIGDYEYMFVLLKCNGIYKK